MSLEMRVRELEWLEKQFTIGLKLVYKYMDGKMTKKELKDEVGKLVKEIEGQ